MNKSTVVVVVLVLSIFVLTGFSVSCLFNDNISDTAYFTNAGLIMPCLIMVSILIMKDFVS